MYMRKILFFVCAMLTWLHTDVTAKTLVFSITAAAQENQTMIVRLAEIEVYPQYLKEYLEFANERILEIYASEEAYQQHLKTDHFQKYKQGTLHMVKDLKLPTMKPLDPETMKLIFRKQR